MAFRFSIVSDVREVLRGNEAMERGFEDTADSLDDLARAAQRSGEKVERSLDDSGDAADDASDKLERKFRDAFRQVERDAKSAGDEVGDRLKRGGREAEGAMDRVTETTGEFKDEARANFAEVTSSFSGDMDSIVDLAQGTFGGLAGTLTGPLGLALGGLAAAGGLFYNTWKDASEKTKEAISGMYEDMLASGADFLSRDAIQERVSAIVTGAEDAAVKYSELQQQAEVSGASVQDLLLAWSGDQDAINRVLDTTNRKLEETSQKWRDGAIAQGEYNGTRYQLTDLQDRISGVSENLGIAADGARTTKEAMNRLAQTRVDIPIDANADGAYAELDNLGRVIGSQHPVVPLGLDTRQAMRDLESILQPRTLTLRLRGEGMRNGTSVP